MTGLHDVAQVRNWQGEQCGRRSSAGGCWWAMDGGLHNKWRAKLPLSDLERHQLVANMRRDTL